MTWDVVGYRGLKWKTKETTLHVNRLTFPWCDVQWIRSVCAALPLVFWLHAYMYACNNGEDFKKDEQRYMGNFNNGCNKPDANVNILGSQVAVFGSPGTVICIIPSSQVLLIQSPRNGIQTPWTNKNNIKLKWLLINSVILVRIKKEQTTRDVHVLIVVTEFWI